MCINKTVSEKMKYSEDLLEDLPSSDHPSTEQFSMLLNLLPPNTIQDNENDDLDDLALAEADILMAAVNYILSLTKQLEQKLRRGRVQESGGA